MELIIKGTEKEIKNILSTIISSQENKKIKEVLKSVDENFEAKVI